MNYVTQTPNKQGGNNEKVHLSYSGFNAHVDVARLCNGTVLHAGTNAGAEFECGQQKFRWGYFIGGKKSGPRNWNALMITVDDPCQEEEDFSDRDQPKTLDKAGFRACACLPAGRVGKGREVRLVNNGLFS